MGKINSYAIRKGKLDTLWEDVYKTQRDNQCVRVYNADQVDKAVWEGERGGEEVKYNEHFEKMNKERRRKAKGLWEGATTKIKEIKLGNKVFKQHHKRFIVDIYAENTETDACMILLADISKWFSVVPIDDQLYSQGGKENPTPSGGLTGLIQGFEEIAKRKGWKEEGEE